MVESLQGSRHSVTYMLPPIISGVVCSDPTLYSCSLIPKPPSQLMSPKMPEWRYGNEPTMDSPSQLALPLML